MAQDQTYIETIRSIFTANPTIKHCISNISRLVLTLNSPLSTKSKGKLDCSLIFIIKLAATNRKHSKASSYGGESKEKEAKEL